MTGSSFKLYIAKLWKCLEIIAIILFMCGLGLLLLFLSEINNQIHFNNADTTSSIEEATLQTSRIFFGISLCIFYHRILELFTVNLHLGPMVIMLQSMVS